ncbi:urease accessory protein UreH [Oceaniovalibus guishaninsula JLT2003]|uniref:Urease accessory protein UreD n=1 Tax=Oceaniovalibus guishaninsula JLT2003 TaxID=1231392 RepID=K2I2T0_9RHOB|nr:urease accessory protein UreD [Oceaniovalibus guishaninsula]EKE43145.1 urease accessory protein UreH [Oceaniovalibus guishaninsula JLT2003]
MFVSSLPEPAAANRMVARAALASERSADGRTSRIRTLRSDGPLVLRPSNPKGAEPLTHRRHDVARISLAAGTAGPLGGDDYALDIHVGAGSTLVLQEVAAMLVLPGATGGRSRMSIDIRIERDATFVWWPEPIIAAGRCDHCHNVRIAMDPAARLVLREETILGRHGEAPGAFASRLRITRAGAALYDQRLSFGPASTGWNGAAVLGNAKAVGSVVAVDPGWGDAPPSAAPFDRDAALTPLAGPGIAIGAVAADSLTLRRLLIRGLNELGSPWAI